MKIAKYLGLVLALLLVAGVAAAQGKGQGKGKGKQDSNESAGEKVREVLPEAQRVFTVEERTKITRWFSTNRSGLPPGLAKRDRLPPGLEKQLRERGTLPPGLQKKIQPLPPQLERELRVLPTGYRFAVIAGNVVLMNEKTALIYDIIRNAIP
jgi:hypothetical protein